MALSILFSGKWDGKGNYRISHVITISIYTPVSVDLGTRGELKTGLQIINQGKHPTPKLSPMVGPNSSPMYRSTFTLAVVIGLDEVQVEPVCVCQLSI